jgi:hypothetical protein
LALLVCRFALAPGGDDHDEHRPRPDRLGSCAAPRISMAWSAASDDPFPFPRPFFAGFLIAAFFRRAGLRASAARSSSLRNAWPV